MKRRNFIKAIGLVAALPNLAQSLRADDSALKKTVSTHKVLTCNVRVDVPADSKTGDGWKHRKEMCADIIKAQKADLFGLQEAQEIHWKDLKSRMPEYDTYALSYFPTTFHPINAIFFLRSRYELISAGGFWLSETPHIAFAKSWDSALPRLVNWVDLKERSSGKEFRYWNTHLDHKGQQARAKSAALIVQASDVLPKEFPQILTGDMNAGIENQAITNFTEGGWVDTFAAANPGKDPGQTFHGFRGPKAAPHKKIDWIFCRGAVKPLAAAVIRDGRNGHYPSDHYFVSAVVEL
ncbi:MAG: Endonuclease/Exonuclease/phosphatase family protein [Verrucomicrobiales bacterium]|nr:Endonuclease/Exonuclease/phosphatase family protein [Verrucomicrobiales bacterium]